jgi:Mrp family chromosome partitioning ATPase
MSSIKRVIVVLSGKGGVGKSTVSTQLAYSLAAPPMNQHVGLLDIDICGPSVPTLTSTQTEEVHQTASGWEPIAVSVPGSDALSPDATGTLAVMSIGHLLPSRDDAVIWRGARKHGMIKQFLRDVNWGVLDTLIIDTPPGTSDEHLSVIQTLQKSGIDGAVIVTTPQEVALADVRKEINFCRRIGVKVVGVVENMSGFVCPECAHVTNIFHPSSGGAQPMCDEFKVPFLGKIPLDPVLTRACDAGQSYASVQAEGTTSPGLSMFAEVVAAVRSSVEQ